ncbi:MAG: YIP1 family protein, partial [archaeon]
YSLYVIFHPFSGFWELKYEKKGNIFSAISILFLASISYVFMRYYRGFIFSSLNLRQFNVFTEMLSIIIPLLLWVFVNWGFTTLMEGKGSIRDIFVSSSFALVPIILINIPVTILSNYITLEEGTFFYFFIFLGVVWTIALIFSSTIVIHEYSLSKTILTIICIIIGMGTVLFILVVAFMLASQITHFFQDIYNEILYKFM